MSNKFSALILSLCLMIAGGLFLTSCSDGGYTPNPSSATSKTETTSGTDKTSETETTGETDKTSETETTGDSTDKPDKPDDPDKPDEPGVDLDKTKDMANKNLTETWDRLSKIYPDLKTSEFADDYSALLAAVQNAKTVEEINNLGSDFSGLINRIRESNLEVNVDEYRKSAKEYFTARWNGLLSQYSQLAYDTIFCENYEQILRRIDEATDKNAVDEVAASFDELVNDVSARYATQELQLYKFDKTLQINQQWEDLTRSTEAYPFATRDEFLEFTRAYDAILSAIDDAKDKAAVDAEVKKFDSLRNDVRVWLDKEITIQMYIADITNQTQRFRDQYQDYITPDIDGEIYRLHEAFISSKTAAEALTNKDALLEYLKKTEQKFTSHIHEEELNTRKQQSVSVISEVLESVRKDYSDYFSFDESDYAPINDRITEIEAEITDAKTYDELNKIDGKIRTDFRSYAEEVLLKASIAKAKQNVNDSWKRLSSGLTENKNLYEQLKNDLLYTADFTEDMWDLKSLKSITDSFEGVLNQTDGSGGFEFYRSLTTYICNNLPSPIIKAIEKKLNVDNLEDYVISGASGEEPKTPAETFKAAADRFAEIKNAYKSVKDMVYIKDASLNKEWIKVTFGANQNDLLSAIASEISIIALYNDERTEEFRVTSDMFKLSDVNLNKIGSYTLYISYKTEYIKKHLELLVIIEPDMSTAKEIGTYAASGYYLQSTGFSTGIVLYDNGVLKLIWNDSQTLYAYTDKGDYIEIDYGDGFSTVSGAMADLITLTKTENGNFFDFYRPEGEPIYEFNGYATSLPEYIWVYGTYTGPGRYTAIYSPFGLNTDENGRPLGFPAYCTLDIENKKFTMLWKKMTEETVYTWDDSPAMLREFLDDYKEEAAAKVNKEWQALIDAGYDVSYWENNPAEGKDYILNLIETAMYRDSINVALNSWAMIEESIKKNYYTSITLNFDYWSFKMKVGGDIEAFIQSNIVGQTISACLYYGFNDKVITITRDMITYNGTTENQGTINFIITYHDKVYQDISSDFQIEVWPSEYFM